MAGKRISIQEEIRRIDALRNSATTKEAAIKCNISIETMKYFVKSRVLKKIIGINKTKQQWAELQAIKCINKCSGRKKKITIGEIKRTITNTGSIKTTSKKYKIPYATLAYHCKKAEWTGLSAKKYQIHENMWKNPYKALEKLAKRKTRTPRLSKKLFEINFLMPMCGFQNTPTGINYEHKDKIGGWYCPYLGPNDYDENEPIFYWNNKELNLGRGFEMDHIDGNPHNDHWRNLRVLCLTCHSLTPTYKNRRRTA